MTEAPSAQSPTPELIGVGSPLVDLLLTVDDDFLQRHVPGAKGGMELVSAETIIAIAGQATSPIVQAAGGAASNTVVGCANLGIRSAFIGCVGADDFAAFYREALTSQGCEPRLITTPDQPTGRVLSLITPDAQRTLRTCLGAAAAITPAQVRPADFQGVRLVMLEGYALFNQPFARAVAEAATAAGAKLALDLASFEVVRANREVLAELLDHHVDIVFANEDEAKAWNPAGPEAALSDLAARVEVAVVKLGKDGALIASQGATTRVAADIVEAVDTTGAGDCFAAGFLAGWLRNLPLVECGRLGAMAGAAVVQVVGAQVPRPQWLRIKGYLDAWA